MPLVPPYIAELHAYEAGLNPDDVKRRYDLENVVKLASNENPLGPSPVAREAIAAHTSNLNRYPNGGLDLRSVLAREFELKVENVIAGSGSEGIMSNIIRAFLGDEEEVLTTNSSFTGFQVLAKPPGVTYRPVPDYRCHYNLP